ncbi:hypothetical protein Cgig2_022511 [Carnegiea gigantea]|uniref:Uncharacterized protein n=1 Tax=Carnegiea gigantea TaxID=171969 RepID=A0A9Q1GNH3_9CARY|nr:hypothetical protein Cgig2_022511 [Carnegiea gigantea]
MGCEPYRKCDPAASPRYGERVQEAPRVDGDRWSREENRDHSIGAHAYPTVAQATNVQQSQQPPLRHMQHTLDEPLDLKSKNRPRGLGEGSLNDDGLPSVFLTALHEMANKGQIDQFLKQGLRFLRKEREPAWPEPRDKEYSTEIVATIAGGYAKGYTKNTSTYTNEFHPKPEFYVTRSSGKV